METPNVAGDAQPKITLLSHNIEPEATGVMKSSSTRHGRRSQYADTLEGLPPDSRPETRKPWRARCSCIMLIPMGAP